MVAEDILIVEDDADLAAMLSRVLATEGYAVTVAPNGQRGLHLALTCPFAAMILDRGLPAIEGLDLLQRLRRRGIVTPILVLSARGLAQDRIEGLDAGAEDYLAKPFDIAELVARVRALLRRHQDTAQVLTLAEHRLNLASREAVSLSDGRVTVLSEREAALLGVLASRPTQVFSRVDLLIRVFSDAESENVVDTYVHYCRRKLGRQVIRTVRGVGYKLGV